MLGVSRGWGLAQADRLYKGKEIQRSSWRLYRADLQRKELQEHD